MSAETGRRVSERMLADKGAPAHHPERPVVADLPQPGQAVAVPVNDDGGGAPLDDLSGDGAVAELLDHLRSWQHLPDPSHVFVALAVAVTALSDDGEPAWLLVVAPPSSGKTEVVRLVDAVAAAHLGEVTVAGLLAWSKRGKAAKPVGLLTRVERGLVTLGDLSTLLSTSDRGGRDQVFALLRRVYDGEVQRDVGSASGADVDGTLRWAGRLTVLGAVTGVIDNYSAHADALGARWLYCRLPERSTAQKRAAAQMARRRDLQQNRAEAAKLAAGIVHDARSRLPDVELSEPVLDAIEDAALVCCWGRAAVPRHGYGAREIDGLPNIEEPPRIVRQLATVARGLAALGCTDEEATALCRRLALDSMPAVRHAVLDVLTIGAENMTTANVGAAAGLHRAVARRTLEDLEAIGVVHGQRQGEDPPDGEPDRRPCCWSLTGDEGDVINSVFHAAGGGGTKCGDLPPLPPGIDPHFVPPRPAPEPEGCGPDEP